MNIDDLPPNLKARVRAQDAAQAPSAPPQRLSRAAGGESLSLTCPCGIVWENASEGRLQKHTNEMGGGHRYEHRFAS